MELSPNRNKSQAAFQGPLSVVGVVGEGRAASEMADFVPGGDMGACKGSCVQSGDFKVDLR